MANHLANLKACIQEFRPEEFGVTGNIANQWNLWLKNFEYCVEFESIKCEDGDTSKKKAALMVVGGPRLREIFETLSPVNESYEEAKRVLSEYFTPQKNLTAERYKFLCTRPESHNETHSQWVTRLKTLVKNCEFNQMNDDEAIKLVITLHTNSEKLQNEIITRNLNLKDTLNRAEMIELAEKEIKFIRNNTHCNENNRQRTMDESDIHAIKKKNSSKSQCWNCGGEFPHRNTCPAKKVTCGNCGKRGHFARVCKSKKDALSNTLHNVEPTGVSNDNVLSNASHNVEPTCVSQYQSIDSMSINTINEKAKEDKNPNMYPSTNAKIKVNGQYVTMQVDSGAEVNVINEKTYMELAQKPKLKQTSVKLRPYKSKPLPVKGYIVTEVSANGTTKTDTRIYVTAGSNGKNLLGKYTAFDLKILSINLFTIDNPESEGNISEMETGGNYQVKHMSYSEMSKYLTPVSKCQEILKGMINRNADIVNELKQRFHNVFTGIGKHKFRKITLNVDENVPPIVQPVRRIPFAKREKLDDVLTELENAHVIEPVEGPTDWISNLVLTPKANPNEIRMNIDMTTVNKAIRRTRHVIPTIEELKYRLNGMTHFSKIDLKHGYMQFELAEESRHLTTFYTHRGLRRAKRLMFGINAATEVFNEEVKQTFSDISNALNIYDDILVFGKNKQEHDLALIQTVVRLSDCGLTANLPKCIFDKPKLEFFGLVFSEQGTSPSEEKVNAIKNLDTPKSASEVRSFLGMANFSCHFMQNYSNLTHPLRELTKKNAQFNWTPECQEAFESIKEKLSTRCLNTYYDPSKETKVIVDGSKKDGLGAMLAQKNPKSKNWEVVRYDSRPVTAPERNYSQIEIESAAIEWANKKYRIYLLGMPTYDVVTDHQPLIPLYNSYKAEIPARVMKHKINLQGYAYKLVHEPGKSMPSDYMSRHPMKDSVKADNDVIAETELFVNTIVEANLPDALTKEEIQRETQLDTDLQDLMASIRLRELNEKEKPHLSAYKNVFSELSIFESMVIRGHKIVPPTKLREKAVRIAHEGHQGLVKSKSLLRTSMWFPRMDLILEDVIKSCHACQIVTCKPQKEPLNMVPIPEEPWTNLRTDFYGPVSQAGEYILVVQDEHSRYPDVEIVHSTSSRVVIPALDRIMSRFGIPKILRSDNGPPFQGEEFAEFAKWMGIKHVRVTPCTPWANGLVERFMPSLTKIIQTSIAEGLNWRQTMQRFLRSYRATPHPCTGTPPAMALGLKSFKTRLPSPINFAVTLENHRLRKKDAEMKLKMKINADEKAYVKPNPIKVGDWVLCKQSKKNKLSTPYYPKPMEVIKRKGTRITASVDGKQITRHANHFKVYHFPKGNCQTEEYCDSAEETSGEDSSRHHSGEHPRVSSNGSAELPAANFDSSEEASEEHSIRNNSRETPRVSNNGSAELPTANYSLITNEDRHAHVAPQTDVANHAQDTQQSNSGRPSRATHRPVRFGYDEHVQTRP